jgi:hypothetical protein
MEESDVQMRHDTFSFVVHFEPHKHSHLASLTPRRIIIFYYLNICKQSRLFVAVDNKDLTTVSHKQTRRFDHRHNTRRKDLSRSIAPKRNHDGYHKTNARLNKTTDDMAPCFRPRNDESAFDSFLQGQYSKSRSISRL